MKVKVEPVQLGLPEEVVTAQYNVLSARLSRLSQGVGELANPGFEPSVARAAAGPAPGWTSTEGASVMIDPERPHTGQGALRLEARNAAATAIGEWFVPPGGSTLELHIWLRADRADTKARVWIEAESAGQPMVRRAEVPVRTDWAEQRIRISNLPDAGLDRMRLRFELIAPGKLWVDDLALSGERPSEATLRAQRTLVAALQKFRERRYADFARLAGSYWAHASAEPVRTGAATDLPPGRRLR